MRPETAPSRPRPAPGAPTTPATRPRHRRAAPGASAAVFVGGALGATLRYELGLAFAVAPGRFPWTTFAINVSGAFVLGALLTLVVERWPPTRYVRPFLAIGALGAYTTFSTFAVEADLLVKRGAVGVATAYVLGTLTAGLAAAYLGIMAGRATPAVGRSTR